MCKLYKIQIYHGDRINTNEIKGATENDKFLLWSRDNDPNDNTGKDIGPTYNWTLNYFGKDQKLADGTDGVKNGIVELQATKIKSGANINDNGFTTSNVTDPTQPLYNTFTYQHDYGQIGTFRMRGKDMEKNMKYVADYGDHNVTVAYQQTMKYPYTWDFMDMIGYSVSHFSNEDAIGIGSSITTNKPTWFISDDDCNLSYEKSSTDLSLWEKLSGNNPAYELRLNSQKEQGDGDLKEKDNIFETAKDIPTVILNGSFPGNTVYSVMCNDTQATAMAVDFLVAEGRRKPLYVYHSLNESGIKKRSGYREGVQKHALSVGPEHEIFTDGMSKDVTSVARLITEKWNSGLRFDSVITSEDILAVGALKSLHALGLRIPEDISIIGYNNSDLCLCTDPELSSIDNRLPVICERIVETMVHVLEGTEMPIQTVFNAQLVERESTLHSPQKQKGKET